MSFDQLTTDELEQQLVASQQIQNGLKARDLEVLEELDRRQVATGDGCKSLSEWTAAQLDLSLDSAKQLVRTMRRTASRPYLRELLAAGEVSFDRVEALSRIHEDVGLLQHLDIGGVLSEAAKRVRITAEDEMRNADDQFLVMQPNLDESSWRLWGGLDGYSGAIVDKALTEAADQLPALPDGSRGDSSWRKANALVQLCVSDDPSPAQVTVFVDTREAAETGGEAGVVLEAGPRVGKQALEAVLCDATIEVTARATDGEPMRYGRKQRTAPPALRRALIHAQGGMCAADGCTSRYRLQVHHVNSWAAGGETNRRPGGPLLVPPSGGDPPARFQHLPTSHSWADPLPSPRHSRPAPTHLNGGVTPLGVIPPQASTHQPPIPRPMPPPGGKHPSAVLACPLGHSSPMSIRPAPYVSRSQLEGRVIGMAGGYQPDDTPDERGIWGMWVAPETRRQGIGVELVEAVRAWSELAGAKRLTLWVVDSNEPAVTLYRSLGFKETGKTQSLPSNHELTEIELAVSLEPL